MSTKFTSKETLFRNDLVFACDPKMVSLDSILVILFMQIRNDGRRVATRIKKEHTLETIKNALLQQEKDNHILGVEANLLAAQDWVRCNLVNLVFRGNSSKEKVSSLRPMHLESYLMTNLKHCRDYFAADQLYLMLKEEPDVLNALRDYMRQGFDTANKAIVNNGQLDLDTVALLHLVKNIQTESRTTTTVRKLEPFLKAQAKLYCDDVLRLLTYQDKIPRSVMIEYLRYLNGFHLALYQLKLLQYLPRMVEQGTREIPDDWSLVIDVTGDLDSSVAPLACADMELLLNGLTQYIKATYAINIEQMRVRDSIQRDDIDYLLARLHNPPADTEAYYAMKVDEYLQKYDSDEEDEKNLVLKKLKLITSSFEQYLSLLVDFKKKYWINYCKQFLTAVAMANSPSALIAGGRNRAHERRGVLGPKLMELLVQLLVLKPNDKGGFTSRELSVNQLIAELRKRYGLIVDGTVEERFKDANVQQQLAFRENVKAFKDKLRQIGFYTDLSDAGTLQKIRPRYEV